MRRVIEEICDDAEPEAPKLGGAGGTDTFDVLSGNVERGPRRRSRWTRYDDGAAAWRGHSR
jgi:hypothetical protein